MIPMPFTKVVFVYGQPISVPKDASDQDMEELRRRVQDGLEEATLRAQMALCEEAVWKA